MCTETTTELRPAHEVMVSEISKIYRFHSTWNEREEEYKAKHEELPFRMFEWMDDQSQCELALQVLCSVLEQMIIPAAHLASVITKLRGLCDSDIYARSPIYRQGLNDILITTINRISQCLQKVT